MAQEKKVSTVAEIGTVKIADDVVAMIAAFAALDVEGVACLPGDVTVYNKQGQYNVHDNHNGLVDCKDCHTIDGTSNLVCVTCHYMELPEGWEGFY